MLVISFSVYPLLIPKNTIAAIVDNNSAITGVPRKDNSGLIGFITGMIVDKVFKMIKTAEGK